jgi:hypothetical protein
MEVGEESGWEKIHTVCLLSLNVEMLMVFGEIYISWLGMQLSQSSIFNTANERVNSSVLAYLGPNAHVGLVHTR